MNGGSKIGVGKCKYRLSSLPPELGFSLHFLRPRLSGWERGSKLTKVKRLAVENGY